MKDFKSLKVWEKSHSLTMGVYKATTAFPGDERYGLTSQIRRASASIPANIAEGCGRDGGRDFTRFLTIARGSASELEYHLYLSRDLGFLDEKVHTTLSGLVIEIKRMLTALIQKLNADH